MQNYLKQNTAYPLIVAVINTDGDYVTGLSITYEVRKTSDNSLFTSGTLNGVGNVYVDNVTITSIGDYYALYITPTGYENGQEELIVQASTTDDIDVKLDTMVEKLCRILGLVQENFRIIDQVYDANGDLTFARVRLYPSDTDVENDTNHFAEYEVDATYVGRLVTDYKAKRTL